jgi:hypothetical protein
MNGINDRQLSSLYGPWKARQMLKTMTITATHGATSYIGGRVTRPGFGLVSGPGHRLVTRRVIGASRIF